MVLKLLALHKALLGVYTVAVIREDMIMVIVAQMEEYLVHFLELLTEFLSIREGLHQLILIHSP